MKYCVKLGNCLDELKTIPDESCRCCVTSPPYWGLRDYGEDGQLGMEDTPQEFVKNMVKVFREVKRILTPDGTFWLNIGDSYVSAPTGSRGKCTGKDQGFGENHKHSGAALKRRDKRLKDLPEKNLIGVPWRLALALQDDGWILRQDIIWAKPNPMPESVKDRCTKSHEYVFLLTKQKRYYYDHEAIFEEAAFDGRKDTKLKGSQKYEDGEFLPGKNENTFHSQPHERWPNMKDGVRMRNKRSVWRINTAQFKGSHFAVMPVELAQTCIKAGSEEGDWILDPFSGAATTGVAAIGLDRNYIGTELSPEFRNISLDRLEEVEPIYSEEVDNIGE